MHEISIKNNAKIGHLECKKIFPDRAILIKKCANVGKIYRTGFFVKKSKKIVKTHKKSLKLLMDSFMNHLYKMLAFLDIYLQLVHFSQFFRHIDF